MSRPAPRSLSTALAQMTAALAPATTLARVQQLWEQTAGPAIAQAGRPVAERAGVLTVACSDSVWTQELEMMGPELVARLNEALGEPLIERLRCRTG